MSEFYDHETLMDTDYDQDTLDLMEVTLPALKTLYDHMERKMLEAVCDEDYEKVLIYSWRYGTLSSVITDIEITVPLPPKGERPLDGAAAED